MEEKNCFFETIEEKVSELTKKKEKIKMGGGEKKIEEQHKKGKYTARERISLLLDKDSFEELNMFMQTRRGRLEEEEFPCEGVITGYGNICGRPVSLYSQDFTFMGGSAGEVHCQKIVEALQYSLELGIPFIGINDGVGARLTEGIGNMYVPIFYLNTIASGVVPQISIIMGPCAGGASYSPALTDFIFMVKNTSYMFLTGPEVIKAGTGEKIDMQGLGGEIVHTSKSGVAHFLADSEKHCFEMVKKLLSYLPLNNSQEPPHLSSSDDNPDRIEPELQHIIPTNPSKGYDVRKIINLVVDNYDFFEIQPLFAPNIIIGFARMNGHVVGIIANQPRILAGCLDINASCKAARFVRFCDAFNIPILTFVDVPGYLPGVDQEYGGIIRHGAKLLYAYAEATVPKITVVLRKNYGGGYGAMCPKGLGADIVYAFPTAEIAIMGPEGAVNVLFQKKIKSALNPEEERKKLIIDYRQKYCNSVKAAELGLVNDIIEPAKTRPHLIKALEFLRTKKKNLPYKKHGNIPL
jgi:acetyl-CoA carboxylase carboxyltransferase component